MATDPLPDRDGLLAIMKDLQGAAGELHRIEMHRGDYGRTYFVVKDRGMVPFDEARAEAMKKLEAALERSGVVQLAVEKAALTDGGKAVECPTCGGRGIF